MMELGKRKPVSFKAFLPLDNRSTARRQDTYVVTIRPEGIIAFRQLGCREDKEIRITLAECLAVALRKEHGV